MCQLWCDWYCFHNTFCIIIPSRGWKLDLPYCDYRVIDYSKVNQAKHTDHTFYHENQLTIFVTCAVFKWSGQQCCVAPASQTHWSVFISETCKSHMSHTVCQCVQKHMHTSLTLTSSLWVMINMFIVCVCSWGCCPTGSSCYCGQPLLRPLSNTWQHVLGRFNQYAMDRGNRLMVGEIPVVCFSPFFAELTVNSKKQ